MMATSFSDNLSRSPEDAPAVVIAEAGAGGLGWWALALGGIYAWGVVASTAMQIEFASSVQLLAPLVVLGAIFIVYGRFRPNKNIQLASGVLVMITGSAILAGIISNAGLRLRRPLIDAFLSRADHALGLDTPALVLTFVGHPILNEALSLAYLSAVPIMFVTAVWFAVRGQTERVWEIGWGFSVCILLCAIISIHYPAIGNFAYANLEGVPGRGLPAGSGTYHLVAFRSLHEGTEPILDLRQMGGLVTFPSFHVIMPLIVVWAFRGCAKAVWAASIWGIAVVVSTIPIGGHYVIDLAGGVLLWLGTAAIYANHTAKHSLTMKR